MKSWLLLINYEGRVTSGSAMTLVYQNKKFIAYVPYFTHSVAAEGRDCDECHQNSAVLKIQKGENVPVVDFQNGRVTPWEGVVPVIEGKLDWVFLNRTEEGWEPVSAEAAPMVQFAAFGSPLTESQFRELTQHDSKKEEKNKTN
jgi:hypothetical protein